MLYLGDPQPDFEKLFLGRQERMIQRLMDLPKDK